MNVLRYSLFINGVFSLTTGSLIIAFRTWMGTLFGVSEEWLWWIIGASLILFSLFVLDQAKKKQKVKIYIITTLDLLWVISSIALILIHPDTINSSGYGLISGVAILVFCFGLGQWLGLKMSRQSGIV